MKPITYSAVERSVLAQVHDLYSDRPGHVALASLVLMLGGAFAFGKKKRRLGAALMSGSTGTITPLFVINHGVVTRTSHDMAKERTFTEGTSGPVTVRYVGSVPVITLVGGTTARERGQAQGYALGPNIHEACKRYLNFVAVGTRSPRARKKILEAAKGMRFVDSYREEMEGLVEGYNKWLEESGRGSYLGMKASRLTLDDIVVMHCFQNVFKDLGFCTAFAAKRGGQAYLARNLDWETAGVLGKLSAVIYREAMEGKNAFVTVGIGGQVGTLTGMNEHGLCIAVNEAGMVGSLPGKAPYGLLIRETLEGCKTVAEARTFLKSHLPASSCIFTLCDTQEVASLHFHTAEGEMVEPKETAQGLCAASNHHRTQAGKPIADSMINKTTEARYAMVEKAADRLKDDDEGFFAVASGLLKEANLPLSFQKVGFDPVKRTLRVAFNNYNAGHDDWRKVEWKDLKG